MVKEEGALTQSSSGAQHAGWHVFLRLVMLGAGAGAGAACARQGSIGFDGVHRDGSTTREEGGSVYSRDWVLVGTGGIDPVGNQSGREAGVGRR